MMFGGDYLLSSKRSTPFLPPPKQITSQRKTGMQGPWPGLSIPLVSTCSELSVVNCRSATQLYSGRMPVKRHEGEVDKNHWRLISDAPRTLFPGLCQELGVGLPPTPKWRNLKGSWSRHRQRLEFSSMYTVPQGKQQDCPQSTCMGNEAQKVGEPWVT